MGNCCIERLVTGCFGVFFLFSYDFVTNDKQYLKGTHKSLHSGVEIQNRTLLKFFKMIILHFQQVRIKIRAYVMEAQLFIYIR